MSKSSTRNRRLSLVVIGWQIFFFFFFSWLQGIVISKSDRMCIHSWCEDVSETCSWRLKRTSNVCVLKPAIAADLGLCMLVLSKRRKIMLAYFCNFHENSRSTAMCLKYQERTLRIPSFYFSCKTDLIVALATPFFKCWYFGGLFAECIDLDRKIS